MTAQPRRLSGSLDERGNALLDLQVVGPSERRLVTCVIDTGFTGPLTLPRTLVDQLQLRRRGVVSASLANGAQVVLERYSAEVDWWGTRRRIRVYATAGATALIGVRLLTPHRLTIDYGARTVEII